MHPSSAALSVSSLHRRLGDGYGVHLDMVGVGRVEVMVMVVLLDVFIVVVLNTH